MTLPGRINTCSSSDISVQKLQKKLLDVMGQILTLLKGLEDSRKGAHEKVSILVNDFFKLVKKQYYQWNRRPILYRTVKDFAFYRVCA